MNIPREETALQKENPKTQPGDAGISEQLTKGPWLKHIQGVAGNGEESRKRGTAGSRAERAQEGRHLQTLQGENADTDPESSLTYLSAKSNVHDDEIKDESGQKEINISILTRLFAHGRA